MIILQISIWQENIQNKDIRRLQQILEWILSKKLYRKQQTKILTPITFNWRQITDRAPEKYTAMLTSLLFSPWVFHVSSS